MSKVDLSAWPSGIQSGKTSVGLKGAGGDGRVSIGGQTGKAPCSLCGRNSTCQQVLQLQCRWREVSQCERKAKLRNAQLIQDFQRAEDTVRDLAARTAAMSTIRAEYEKQLRQKCPRRLQKLEEKRTCMQCKKVELNLNKYLGRQEGEKVTQSDIGRGPAGAQSPCSSADPPHLLTSSPHPPPDSKNSYFHTLENDLMDSQIEDYTQNNSDLSCHPMAPNSWLTQGQPRKSVSQTRTISDHLDDASMETRGSQGFPGAACPVQHPLPPLASQPFDPCWLLPPMQPLSGWFGLYSTFPPRPQFTLSAGPQQGGPSLHPGAWGVDSEPAQDQNVETCMSLRRWDKDGSLEGGATQEADRGLRQRWLDRQEKPCNQSFELDVKPVRLRSTRRGSSESSSVCIADKSNGVPALPRKKKEKRGRIKKICTDWMRTLCRRSCDGVSSSMETLTGHRGHSLKTSGHSVIAKQRSGESSPNKGETESAHSSGETEKTEKDGLTQEGTVEGQEMGKELGGSEETDNGDENDPQSSSQAEEEDEEAEESKECSKEEESSGEEESEEDDEEIEGCLGNEEKGETGEDDEVQQAPGEGGETSDGGTEDGETDDSPEQEQEEISGHERVTGLQGSMLSAAGGEKTAEELEEVEDNGNGQESEEEEDDSQEGGYSEDDSEEEGDVEEERQVTPEEGDGEQDEEDGTGSLGESKEEDEVREDFSKDEEEMNKEEGGSEVEEMGVTDCKEDESERTTDSDDEIISSQLDNRASQAMRDGGNFTGKSDAAEKMSKIDEEVEENEETGEQEHQESAGDDTTGSDGAEYSKALFKKVITDEYEDEDGQCGDDEEDIEILLAPYGHPEIPQTPEVVAQVKLELEKEASDTVSCDPQREKKKKPAVKTKAPWHDSETDSGDVMLAGQELSACNTDGQDDFDDFYD